MYKRLKFAAQMALFRAKQPFKIAWAVATACTYVVIPRKWLGPDRPWHRRGIRYVKHTSYSNTGVLHAIYFNQGGGYIGGATLYWARNCRRYLGGGCGYKPVKFVVGLTNNGNLRYTAGRY